MKTTRHIFCLCLPALLFVAPLAFADTIIFSNNRTVSGTILQTNDDEVLLLAGTAAFNFSKSNIKEIKLEPALVSQNLKTERLPDFNQTVLFLSQQSWATNLTPIPATVINNGILKNVPYSSFRCGEDYEINIYGDLTHPAGIEIGIYRKLLESASAKDNCIKFIGDLLMQKPDKDILTTLNLKKDIQHRENLTLEITPQTDSDAYNGWWVSVYSDKELNSARASDEEMKNISVTKADASAQSSQVTNSSGWSADDLKLARPSLPETFTFVNKSGDVITNAEVIRIYDPGVSLLWRSGSAMGLVKLADLPKNLQDRFGYDAAKSEAAVALAKEKGQRAAADQATQQAQIDAAAQYSSPAPLFYNSGYSSGGYSSGGGSVYVHGYTRKDGTYVQPYYRNR